MAQFTDRGAVEYNDGMYCLDCRYNLHGLSENRCPECGRRFDPDDSESYDPDPVRRAARFNILAVAAAYPLFPLIMLLCTWFAAWLSLGHSPKVDIDDPKSINAIVSSLYALTSILLIGVTLYVPAAPLVFLAFEFSERHRPRMFKRTGILLAIAVGSVVLLFLLLKSRIGWWYFD